MSAYQSVRPAPFGAIATLRIVSWIEALVEGLRAWRSARMTEAALAELSDGQLADIGLHRGAIAEVAAELARR